MQGKYTIAEVEERTGVAAATLRQWERRYGFPKPQRSTGRYRLYSDADLRGIAQMQAHIADGVPPSRAADLVREEPPEPTGPRGPSDLAAQLTDALRELDGPRAEQLLSEAYALHPVEDVLFEVIGPAMVTIGDLWHAGEVSVATEHFASQFVQGRLRLLLVMTGGGAGARRVVVACAPEEQHELGALMVAIVLSRAGFDVAYLGANTPLEDLAALTRETPVDAVFISAFRRETLARLTKERALLRSLSPLVVFGGRAFEGAAEVARDLGGVFFGNDVRSALPAIQEAIDRRR